MPSQRRSYSTQDVAQRLSVSIQTVQRWVDAGHLKAWKTIGGHRRIDAESAEQLFRSETAARGAGTAGALRVVLVDDNDLDRDVLAHLVRKALPQAELTEADNGFDALVAVGRLQPQILITDVLMPHMDGFEMLRRLGAGARPRHILAISARPAAELHERGPLPTDVTLMGKPLVPAAFFAWLLEAAGRSPVLAAAQP
jgi:excisionase family DNA binding protein